MARGDLMTEPFLTVYGHTNLDYIMSLCQFPPKNTSVDVLEKKRYFGGTAANVATLAAALGVPTALASFVGPDFPNEFRALMLEKGVDLSDLVVVEGYETPTVWIVSDAEHNQVAFVYQGPMGVMDEMPLRMEKALRSQHVHIMTGRPAYYLRLMDQLKKAGRTIGFDPAQEIHHVWDSDRFNQAIKMADMFFGNENEVRTALRYSERTDPSDLLDSVQTVLMTLGLKGSQVMTRQGMVNVPAILGKDVVDTTGCGDAYRAGFYAGLYRGYPSSKAAVFGSAAASFIIEQKGALTNIPNWEQVRERAEGYL
jgi:sugar/nucleoside kinase (ribokinase family)